MTVLRWIRKTTKISGKILFGTIEIHKNHDLYAFSVQMKYVVLNVKFGTRIEGLSCG